MAITDLEPGTLITAKHIGNGPWPRGAELAPDTMTTSEAVIGRITRERITAAQPLRGSMFYAPGDLPDLDIADGKRAVTIRVSDTTAVLNQKLKPGQYVDVQLTVDGMGGDRTRLQSTGGSRGPGRGTSFNNAMTATLFKGVRLVSMNRNAVYNTTSLQGSESGSVTLELSEDQSRIALLAQQKGQIDLVYNPNGPGTGGIEIKTEKDRVTLYELLGLQEEAEQPKPFRAEHYRGIGHSTSYFEDGERVDGMGNDGADTQLQSNSSTGDWTTDASPAARSRNVASHPAEPAARRN
jgi:Flp pilus assembly protein CpaB